MKTNNIKYYIVVLALALISYNARAGVYENLSSEVGSLSVTTSFDNVVSIDRKVTEAAAADLITKDQFETLDAVIRNIYRSSEAFTPLHYSNMPQADNHRIRGASCVLVWGSATEDKDCPITGDMVINEGVTVVMICQHDSHKVRLFRDTSVDHGETPLITVKGNLIIKGSPEHPFIIDGSTRFTGTYTNGGELNSNVTATGMYGSLVCIMGNGNNAGIRTTNAVFQNNLYRWAGSGVIFNKPQNCLTSSFVNTTFFQLWTKFGNDGPSVGSALYTTGSRHQSTLLADGSTFNGLLLNHCRFEGNLNDNTERSGTGGMRLQNGGAAFAIQGSNSDVSIKNSFLKSNYSSWHGGAIFWNQATNMLNLEGSTFEDNYGGIGAAVYIQGNLTLKNSTFMRNHAVCQKDGPYYGGGFDGCGGALLVQPSGAGGQPANCQLILEDCTFQENYAQQDGGAISVYTMYNPTDASHKINVEVSIKGNTLIKNNTAGRLGGGMSVTFDPSLQQMISQYTVTSSISLLGGTIIDNNCNGTSTSHPQDTFQGTGFGGGLFLDRAPLTISDGFVISGNNSAKDGGAVYVATASLIGGSINVTGNTSINGNGGAFCVNGGDVTLTGSQIVGNNALSSTNSTTYGSGGALYVENGTVNMIGGEMKNNHANLNGGAVFVNGGSLYLKSNCIIDGNRSTNGGGAFVDGGSLEFVNGTISSNTATRNGGGAFISGGDVNFNGNINHNNANNGAGLYLAGGAIMTFTGGIITANEAKNTSEEISNTAYWGRDKSLPVEGCGGGIYLENGTSAQMTALNFSFPPGEQTFGLYGNTANKAGQEIIAEGNFTEIKLPLISNMKLAGFEGQDANPNWYQDYFDGDDGYDYSHAVRGNVDHVYRYKRLLSECGDEVVQHLILDDTGFLDSIKNKYLCITLGFSMLDLTVRANGLLGGETALVKLTRYGSSGQKTYDVMLKKGENETTASKTLLNMPWGTYTIEPNNNWNWHYEPISPMTNIRIGDAATAVIDLEYKHKSVAEQPLHYDVHD